jgi:hypothetical protein
VLVWLEIESVDDAELQEIEKRVGPPARRQRGYLGRICRGEQRSIECQPPLSRMCKFLAGALFVNAGILLYLHLSRVSVPILGMRLTETPEVSGVRSLVHAVLFLTFFYLGFIRRWKSRSIK